MTQLPKSLRQKPEIPVPKKLRRPDGQIGIKKNSQSAPARNRGDPVGDFFLGRAFKGQSQLPQRIFGAAPAASGEIFSGTLGL